MYDGLLFVNYDRVDLRNLKQFQLTLNSDPLRIGSQSVPILQVRILFHHKADEALLFDSRLIKEEFGI